MVNLWYYKSLLRVDQSLIYKAQKSFILLHRVHLPSFNEYNLQIINTRSFQHNQLCIAFADEQETAVLLFEQKQ